MIKVKYTNSIKLYYKYRKKNVLEMQGKFGMNEIMARRVIYLFNNKKYLVDSEVID